MIVARPADAMTDSELLAHIAFSHPELPRDAWRLAHARTHEQEQDHVHRAMEDVPCGELL